MKLFLQSKYQTLIISLLQFPSTDTTLKTPFVIFITAVRSLLPFTVSNLLSLDSLQEMFPLQHFTEETS